MPESDSREALDLVLKDFKNALHTTFPARVLRYYRDKQTVDVQACIVRQVPGEDWESDEFEEIPEVVNIPIAWPRSGGFVITFPLKPGDYVLVVCSENGTLVWREKGGVNIRPGIVDDEFGLNGCFAIPAAGTYPDNREHTLRDVSADNFEIRRETGEPVISIAPTGAVRIRSADIEAGLDGAGPVASASKVDAEINKILTLLQTWIPVAQDGGAALNTAAKAITLQSTAASHLKAT